MDKSLVIVESPTKAKTVSRYLGSRYVVKSSVGHIRDLPTSASQRRDSNADVKKSERLKTTKKTAKAKAAERERQRRKSLVTRMGVDPDHDWRANYQILPNKKKVVAELISLANKSDWIYLATDLDREGEAIAWHLRETIGGDPERYRRVVFHEITKPAIAEAFNNPHNIDQNRVNAQQARRFLDRVVGFELTPLLYAKIARGLSAGRVQSVAVRLIVEREREIRAFISEEYFEGFADLVRQNSETTYRFQINRENDEQYRPTSQADADASLERLHEASGFKVLKHETVSRSTKPPAPFITSTLQQSASSRLGFSVRKTMSLAQRLYEAGKITYMRTDSTNLSEDAVRSVRSLISAKYGTDYLPKEANKYISKKTAQEAHEAIRPTNADLDAKGLGRVDRYEARLYELIRNRFIASQMMPARYLHTTTIVEAGDFEIRMSGRRMEFDGFTRVLAPESHKDEQAWSPDFREGELLNLKDSHVVQHFTKPPKRYGEASLIRELDKRGIGRPSTYASIISTIQDRGYVTIKNKRFYAEKVGELVVDRLMENFKNLLNYSFTAELESELDQIALGEKEWKSVLNEFYGDFSERLQNASDPETGMRKNVPTPTDIKCDQCGRHMTLRIGSTGVFLGCEGYSLSPKERCTNTVNLVEGDEITNGDDEDESQLLRTRKRCPKCDTPMESFLIDENRKLYICGNNPDCDGSEIEPGHFKLKGYDGPIVECDKCGADMQLKSGRFGKYFGCTNGDCKNSRKLLRNGEVAPPRADPIPMPELICEGGIDDYYVLRDGAAGLFLAASKYPRIRKTRTARVAEIMPHANELDPKFKFLLSAPETDPNGKPTEIKFSRKTKQYYIGSSENGVPSSWRSVFQDGRWVDQGRAAKKPILSRRRKSTSKAAAKRHG